jgi:hypothetical protein
VVSSNPAGESMTVTVHANPMTTIDLDPSCLQKLRYSSPCVTLIIGLRHARSGLIQSVFPVRNRYW